MFKIHYINRKQIDTEKYDNCVKNAINSRIYACSWYLDIVADDWSALVLDDYKAVMPIPFLRIKSNFFFKKILQPHFCQQLGVFSFVALSKDHLDSFYNKFVSLKPRLYNFNSYNTQKSLMLNNLLTEKVNYELELNKSYDAIYSNYSKNLKRNIKKARKINLTIVNDIPIENFITFKKKNSKHSLNKKQYRIITNLVLKILEKEAGSLYGVQLDDMIIASAFIIKSGKRIIHLLSTTNSLGKKNMAIPFLFDKLIQDNSRKNFVFDFEGSMITSVARFFKSFGAKQIQYYSYKNK